MTHVNRKKNKEHHSSPSSTRVKLQPTAIANGNVPKGEFRRKKNKKVLHALDKAFLDKLDAFLRKNFGNLRFLHLSIHREAIKSLS